MTAEEYLAQLVEIAQGLAVSSANQLMLGFAQLAVLCLLLGFAAYMLVSRGGDRGKFFFFFLVVSLSLDAGDTTPSQMFLFCDGEQATVNREWNEATSVGWNGAGNQGGYYWISWTLQNGWWFAKEEFGTVTLTTLTANHPQGGYVNMLLVDSPWNWLDEPEPEDPPESPYPAAPPPDGFGWIYNGEVVTFTNVDFTSPYVTYSTVIDGVAYVLRWSDTGGWEFLVGGETVFGNGPAVVWNGSAWVGYGYRNPLEWVDNLDLDPNEPPEDLDNPPPPGTTYGTEDPNFDWPDPPTEPWEPSDDDDYPNIVVVQLVPNSNKRKLGDAIPKYWYRASSNLAVTATSSTGDITYGQGQFSYSGAAAYQVNWSDSVGWSMVPGASGLQLLDEYPWAVCFYAGAWRTGEDGINAQSIIESEGVVVAVSPTSRGPSFWPTGEWLDVATTAGGPWALEVTLQEVLVVLREELDIISAYAEWQLSLYQAGEGGGDGSYDSQYAPANAVIEITAPVVGEGLDAPLGGLEQAQGLLPSLEGSGAPPSVVFPFVSSLPGGEGVIGNYFWGFSSGPSGDLGAAFDLCRVLIRDIASVWVIWAFFRSMFQLFTTF